MARRGPDAAGGIAALCILGVISLVLFTVYVKEGNTGPLHTVQLGAAEVLRPLRSVAAVVAGPFETAGRIVGGAFENNAEEEALRREARGNRELAAQASQLEQENARLRELLKGDRTPYEYAPLARVVAPVGGQFTERIVINVGTKDGVEPEQPVIVGNNTLVGRTTGRVTANTAEVILVTDQTFTAGVRIVPPAGFDASSGEVTAEPPPQTPSETTTGTTTGLTTEATAGATTESTQEAAPPGVGLLRTSLDGYLGVEYVPLSADVDRGDFVITSGRAGNRKLLFPPGLLVGTIESATSQDIEQFQQIVVTPAERQEDLEEVRVITDW